MHQPEPLHAASAKEITIPTRITELSDLCRRSIETKYGIAPDSTQDTLGLVDHYVIEMQAEVRANEHVLPLLQASVGAYLGEVFRSTFGGYWFAEGDYNGWRFDFRPVYLTCNPVGMAREGLLGEIIEGWHTHLDLKEEYREEIMHRLDALGVVEESRYVLPSMRFEVVHLVVETLYARMREGNNPILYFAAEDYQR